MRIKVIETEAYSRDFSSRSKKRTIANYEDLTFVVVIDDDTTRISFEFGDQEARAYEFRDKLVSLVNEYTSSEGEG